MPGIRVISIFFKKLCISVGLTIVKPFGLFSSDAILAKDLVGAIPMDIVIPILLLISF